MGHRRDSMKDDVICEGKGPARNEGESKGPGRHTPRARLPSRGPVPSEGRTRWLPHTQRDARKPRHQHPRREHPLQGSRWSCPRTQDWGRGQAELGRNRPGIGGDRKSPCILWKDGEVPGKTAEEARDFGNGAKTDQQVEGGKEKEVPPRTLPAGTGKRILPRLGRGGEALPFQRKGGSHAGRGTLQCLWFRKERFRQGKEKEPHRKKKKKIGNHRSFC